jgi:hypothetical protein
MDTRCGRRTWRRFPARLEMVGEVKAGDWPEPGVCSVGPRAGGPDYDGGSAAGGRGCGGDGGAHLVGGHSVEVHRSVRAARILFRAGRKRLRDNCCWIEDDAWTMPGLRLRLQWARAGCRFSGSRAWLCFRRATRWWRLTRRRARRRFGIRIRIRWRRRFRMRREPVRLAIAPDERGRLRALIEEGLQCDLLLLTGGVSMGKYDLVEQVLAELQAEFYFTGAEIQPGRPVVFGSCGADTLVRAVGSESAASRGQECPRHTRGIFLGCPGIRFRPW